MYKSEKTSLLSHVAPYVRVLRLTGVWPSTRGSGWLRWMSLAYMLCVAAVVSVLLSRFTLSLGAHLTQLADIMEDLWVKVELVALNLKVVIFLLKRRHMDELILFDPCKQVNSSVFPRLRKSRKESRLLAISQICFLLVIYIVGSIFYGYAVFGEHEMPTDVLPSRIKVIMMMIAERLTLIVLLSIHTATSCFYVTFLSFVECYLDHLTESLEQVRVTPSAEKPLPEKPGPDLTSQDVRYCVTLHQFIIGLVERGNSAFSAQLLLKIWRTLIIICLTARELTAPLSLGKRCTIVLVFVTSIFELFHICWLADEVQSKSVRLADRCVDKQWQMRHAGLPRDLVGDMENEDDNVLALQAMSLRSQTPLEMHAGPYYRLSVHTFTTILALSFTYFVFLISVKNF